jgi:hypothetical protein
LHENEVADPEHPASGASAFGSSPESSKSKSKVDAGTGTPHRQRAEDPGADPTNSSINERDNHQGEATADRQSNQRSDVDLTAEIRRSVVSDKSLWMNAHNVKIVAQNGQVTLKGLPRRRPSSTGRPRSQAS